MGYSCKSRLIICFDPNIILNGSFNNGLYVSYHSINNLVVFEYVFFNINIIHVMSELINIEKYL